MLLSTELYNINYYIIMRETTTGRKLNKNMIALVADVDRVCKNIQERNRNSATQSFCPSSEKRKSAAFLDFHFLMNSTSGFSLVDFDCAVDLSHKPVACKETD